MTKKLSNKKGFTLAELLVVVAIIAVLVAVSIPIFSAQTKKATVATNQANARAAKAAAVTAVLGNGTSAAGIYSYDIKTGTATIVASVTDAKTFAGEPSDWKVGSPTDIDAQTYNTWYVTVTATGTVSTYQAK